MPDALTVGYRRNVGGTKFIIGVAVLTATALALEGGAYTFSDEDVDDHLEAPTEVRGKKNSSARLAKLMAKYDALDLMDVEAVAEALGAEPSATAEPEPVAPIAVEPVAATEPEPVAEEAPGEGDSESESLSGDDKKLADMGYSKSQRSRISDSGKAYVFQWELEAAAVSVMADGAVRVFRSRLPENSPLLIKEAAAKAAKAEAKAADKASAAAERKAKSVREPKTFKVYATSPEWVKPDSEGKTVEEQRGQRYLVGDNAVLAEAERVAQVWRDAVDAKGDSFNFTAVVEPDTRSKPKNNLWDGPIEMPCVSRVPGDLWVGDHLGPHLRALNLSFKEYCEEYGLPADTTPKCTNRARASLAKAHAAVRRTHAMRMGQMCVVVGGDSIATVLQITAASGEGEETQYTLQKVAGNDPELMDDEYTWTHQAIIDRTKPINRWSASAKKAAAAS